MGPIYDQTGIPMDEGEEEGQGYQEVDYQRGEALDLVLRGAERLAQQHPAESIDAAFDALRATVLSLAQTQDPHISPDVPVIEALETLGVPKGFVEALSELENARDQALSNGPGCAERRRTNLYNRRVDTQPEEESETVRWVNTGKNQG